MSAEIKKDNCILCGSPSESMEYNHGNGKAFINCSNKLCGEYLIIKQAIDKLDDEQKSFFSEMATSKNKIQDSRKILLISYHGGIQAGYENLTDVMFHDEISKLGFK
jgi:hypothetical protein